MEATARHIAAGQGTEGCGVTRQEAQREDAYWQRNFCHERYYDTEFEYEDYAPAYCVGYVGCVQYGGQFDDAQRCLGANWERIKGDARLSATDAMQAMRAAWERMARQRRRAQLVVVEGGRSPARPRQPSLQLGRLALVPAAAAQ